jgi:hypothetical protein
MVVLFVSRKIFTLLLPEAGAVLNVKVELLIVKAVVTTLLMLAFTSSVLI